eukprot:scaffold15723_cov128-Isochrysis_galbana.AAC.1
MVATLSPVDLAVMGTSVGKTCCSALLWPAGADDEGPAADGGVRSKGRYTRGGGGGGGGRSKSGGYIGTRGMRDGCTGMTMDYGLVGRSRSPFRIVPTIKGMTRSRDTWAHALCSGVTV